MAVALRKRLGHSPLATAVSLPILLLSVLGTALLPFDTPFAHALNYPRRVNADATLEVGFDASATSVPVGQGFDGWRAHWAPGVRGCAAVPLR